MKKLFAIAVLLAGAMTAQAKVGETKAQIIKRFGAAAIVHEQSNVEGDYITFEGKNHVLVLFENSRSICEVYLLRTGYSASDANEIVKTVLGGVRWRWNELDAWRKRSTDGVYEIMLLPTNGRGTYKWGIAVGYSVTVASFGELMVKTDQAAVVPKPQPQTADPNRTPNDCAIIAAKAYAKLKDNTYWCQIMAVHVETANKEANHAMVFYKYQASGHVLVYDARGTVELDTASERPQELAEAIKPSMRLPMGSYPTRVTLKPLTYDEARRYQQSATAKAAPNNQMETTEAVGWVMAVIVLKMVIGGGIGALIGRFKNRMWAGFWWGTCIGWIGWIIAGSMRKKELLNPI